MPSPFPGMDPFLEDPTVFPNLHGKLIAYIEEYLQPRLPIPYFAASSERVWLEASERHIEPDVDVLRRRPNAEANGGEQGAGAALATRTQAATVLLAEEERRQPFLELYARRGGGDRL